MLAHGIASLLNAFGDKDMTVWTVADECLTTVIKVSVAMCICCCEIWYFLVYSLTNVTLFPIFVNEL